MKESLLWCSSKKHIWRVCRNHTSICSLLNCDFYKWSDGNFKQMFLKAGTYLEGCVPALKYKVNRLLCSQNKNLFRSNEYNENNYEN